MTIEELEKMLNNLKKSELQTDTYYNYSLDRGYFPNNPVAPPIEKVYTLTEEEKRVYLEDDNALTQMLKNSDIKKIISIIKNLSPKIDNQLKRKILVKPENLSIILEETNYSSSDIVNLMKSFDSNSEEDALIKQDLFKNNLALLIRRTSFTSTFHNYFSTNNESDAKLKKDLLLIPEYRDIIMKNKGLFFHLELNKEDPVDKDILSEFFLTDNHIQAIKSEMHPGCLLEFLEKNKTDDPFSKQIRRKILLNKEILISICQKLFSLNLISLYNALDVEDETDKEIKIAMFASDEWLSELFNCLKRNRMSNKTDSNLISFLKQLNTLNEVSAEIKQKVYLNANHLQMIAEVIDVLKLLIDTAETEKDLMIIERIINDEDKYNAVIGSCKDKYSLLSSLKSLNIDRKDRVLHSLTRKYLLSEFFPKERYKYYDDGIINQFMDPNNDYDLDTLHELLLNENINAESFKRFCLPAIIFVLFKIDKQKELYKEVNNKLLTDEKYLEKFVLTIDNPSKVKSINKFDSEIKQKIFLNDKLLQILSAKNDVLKILVEEAITDEDLMIIENIITDENKYNITIEGCDDINDLLSSFQKRELVGTNKLLQLLNRKIVLSDNFHESIDIEKAITIIFKFINPNNDYDNETLKQLLFSNNIKDDIIKYFGLPAILSVCKMVDKQNDLYQELERRIVTDNSYLDSILSLIDINQLPSIIKEFNLKNEMECTLLKKIIDSKLMQKIFMEQSEEKNSTLYNIIRVIIKNLNIDNSSEEIVATIDKLISDLGLEQYETVDINEEIRPQNIEQLYEFHRGVIVINANGDQIKVNIDDGEFEETKYNQTPITRDTNSENHHPSIKEALVHFGYPKEELEELPDHPMYSSLYALNHGLIVFQIEGKVTHLYLPKLTPAQFDMVKRNILTISEYEQKIDEKMTIGVVLSATKHIINMLMHDGVFVEELPYIINKEKLFQDTRTFQDTNTNEIAKMFSESETVNSSEPIKKL